MGEIVSHAAIRRERCSLCTARHLGFCAPLEFEELAEVESARSSTRVFLPGAYLYHQGESAEECYTILEGWVAQSITLESGAVQIIDFGIKGSFIGLNADSDEMNTHSARCITPVKVCGFSRHKLKHLMATDARLANRVHDLTACHEARANDHLVNVARRDARGRVAHLLRELFYRLYRRLPEGKGEAIALPLTLAHIGDAVGLTNVHVSRVLRSLRESGVLQLRRSQLLVLDPPAFIAAADVERGFPDYPDVPAPPDSETQAKA